MEWIQIQFMSKKFLYNLVRQVPYRSIYGIITKDNRGDDMIKLIACDLDETLLNSEKEITPANLAAIKKAETEYGVIFVPATGRGYTCLDTVLEALETKDKEGEYIISHNGGVICENKGYRKLNFHTLAFEKAKELFEFGLKKNICIQVFTDQDVYAFQLNEEEKRWLFMFKPDSIVCEQNSIDFLKDEPIVKILFQKTDMDYLHELAKEMEPITKNQVAVSYSSNRYLELNAIGIDKGLGLRELASYLNIKKEETMAIGDNMNDLEMLQAAGVAVAVANAKPMIKEQSDFVTKADNNHDAIAEAIEQYVFLK